MVQRYDLELYHCNGGEIEPCDEGGYVEYEDYKALKAHADAMCEAMCLYDLGERVSFRPYINYTEWLLSEGDV